MYFPAKQRFPYAYVIVSILGIQDILFIVSVNIFSMFVPSNGTFLCSFIV